MSCACFRADLTISACERCKAVSLCAPCKRGRNGIFYLDECDALESLMTGTIDVSSRDEQIQRGAASLKFMNLHMVH
jgi:hypothetical protein